jgi:tetratricopeptide (TPR) repeat protein
VDAGVAGVVAMRYNVYVVTAAQFVADLYESLAGGQALGEAVTLGRKQLEAQPLREIAYTPRPLQDWMVPIVYEAAPVALFPTKAKGTELKIKVSADAATASSGGIARELEARPDAGFFGRDETLLALDRAFDSQSIALLHAYAGSGKTSTAAEFARWYHLTGGVDGPVLLSSFEHRKTLTQALDETIGVAFGPTLERSGTNWLALPEEARRAVALDVMSQIPVLWIWDNVEPIAGFPAGSDSPWSAEEQKALADFLRAARSTKAKILLTSRRDERRWLGDLPARIKVPPMPMQERVQLARALAEKHGRRLSDVEDWIPLLRFTGGNPLTVTVLVGQALRDGLKKKDQIESFVAKLRAGEQAFHDEGDRLGRARCLDQLGFVAHEQFKDARAANQSEEELLSHLNDAVRYCSQALDLAPPDALDKLATSHAALGSIYGDAGDFDAAMMRFREAIQYTEQVGDLYWAANTRRNAAINLAKAGRYNDAKEYAEAALRNFETFGDRAADEIRKTQLLIAEIDKRIQSG